MESVNLGILFIVATPIGNLRDISMRAVDTLREADYIRAEDTRDADKLMREYKIDVPVIAYTDEKHSRLINKITNDLVSGKKIALISDSGTPTISDPGFKLVREIKDKDMPVVPIPGPSALIAALSVSGLPSDKFIFLGFLPKSKTKRQEIISHYGKFEATIIIYESSHRIKPLITEVYKTLGNRKVSLANDLTKFHELVLTTKLENLVKNDFKEKGEFVLMIAKEGF